MRWLLYIRYLYFPIQFGTTKVIRQLKLFNILYYIIWFILVILFCRSLYKVTLLIWDENSFHNRYNHIYTNNDNDDDDDNDYTGISKYNAFGQQKNVLVHEYSQLGDIMYGLWPLYLSKKLLPPKKVTLVWLSGHRPLPIIDNISSAQDMTDHQQFQTIISSALNGVINRLIWIYPSSGQNMWEPFYRKMKLNIGMVNINLHDTKTVSKPTTHKHEQVFSTLCVCNSEEKFCTLPFLLPSMYRLRREFCATNSSLVYEELVDLLAESSLRSEKLSPKPHLLYSIYSENKGSSPLSSKDWIREPLVVHFDMNYFLNPLDKKYQTSRLTSSATKKINAPVSAHQMKSTSYSKLINEYTRLISNVYRRMFSMHSINKINILLNLQQFVDRLIYVTNNPLSNELTSLKANSTYVPNLVCTNAVNGGEQTVNLTDDSDLYGSYKHPQSNDEVNSFHKWKDKLYIFHQVQRGRYCDYVNSLLPYILELTQSTERLKFDLSTLWNWLCELNNDQLSVLLEFTICTSESNSPTVQLCERVKAKHLYYTQPTAESAGLILLRLSQIMSYLPEPVFTALISRPQFINHIQQAHLTSQICAIVNHTVNG